MYFVFETITNSITGYVQEKWFVMITLSDKELPKALIIDFVQHTLYFRHVSNTKISFTPRFHLIHVIVASFTFDEVTLFVIQ